MGQTISIEQLDGMIAEQERAREAIRLKVVAMQDLKALFFGNDASGGGQPLKPVRLTPLPIERTARRVATKETRPLNTCKGCKATWPRNKGRQVRSCPKCETDDWQG
jgi:hypothetical protein